MKNFSICVLFLALAGQFSARAADAVSAPAQGSANTTVAAAVSTTVTAPTPSPAPPLKENMTIRVVTEVAPGIPYALALTGIGPQFRSNTLINIPGDDGATRWIPVSFLAAIGEVADGFEVKVTINLQMAVGNPVPGRAGAMSGKVVSSTATATLKLDEPQKVTGSNGQSLTLSITKPSTK